MSESPERNGLRNNLHNKRKILDFLSQAFSVDISTGPEDTIKIMLATDNHIGYLERDPIRGQDSINTFEEILKLAVKHDVSVPPES